MKNTWETQIRRAAEKAIAGAVRDTAKRTKAKALKTAKGAYAYAAGQKSAIMRAMRVSMDVGRESAKVEFKGQRGEPLRHFKTNRKKEVVSWVGVPNRRRRPKGGVRYKLRRQDTYRQWRKSLFWMQGKNGNVILAYRKGRGNKVSTEELFGPSPMQAIIKRENQAELKRYAEETLEKRVRHYLERGEAFG